MKKSIIVKIEFEPNKYGGKSVYYQKGFKNVFLAGLWAIFQLRGRKATISIYEGFSIYEEF